MRLRRLFRIPDYPAVRNTRNTDGSEPRKGYGHDRAASRKRSGGDKHALRRRGMRKEGHDLVLQSRHQSDDRRHLVHRGCRITLRDNKRDARRTRSRYDSTGSSRLFSNRQGRRSRRLSRHRARSRLSTGNERFRRSELRTRLQVPHSGDDDHRRRHRTDDGKG